MMSELNRVIWPKSISRSNQVLEIGGCTAISIAKKYGTPIFVLDERDLIARAEDWKSTLHDVFRDNAGFVYYAAKAFISVEVAKIIAERGLSLDVCTGGELAVAAAAKFPANRIEMHGNNKSEAEIEGAIDYGVKSIVVDSIQEIERVADIARSRNKVQEIIIRLNPGVEAHTHEYITTAIEDVKFGFSMASGAAWKAVELISKLPSLELTGVHSHIGSQIFESEPFDATAVKHLEFMKRYKDEFDSELPNLIIGGGFGIAYVEGDNPIESRELVTRIHNVIKETANRLGLKVPKVSIEPGRAIIGPSMITLYRVGTTKEIALKDGGNRLYVAVDGGMSDNIRTSLYGAEYTAVIANRISTQPNRDCRIVGKHCESGDVIISSIALPSDIKPGDLLAVAATGAYGRSMASNYNHVPRPGVISVSDGKARTIIRSETSADLLALEIEEVAQPLGEQ
jgi:diaminopimelate decarboxylase